MIRLYFDWNAVAGLKSDRPAGLLNLLQQNDHRFHIFYSTAHIGDIYKGYDRNIGITPAIQSDLDFLDQLTESHFFYYEKPKVDNSIRPAIDLFEDRIITESLPGFMDLLDEWQPDGQNTQELTVPVAELLSRTKNDPIGGSISVLQKIRSTDIYKDLRKFVQSGIGINRDQLYAHPDPIKQLDTILEKSAMPENSLVSYEARLRSIFKNVPEDWFNNIHMRYLFLDMAGYQEDEIRRTHNKTFQNIIEDAFHVAFASQCDFYISNDRRNLAKAEKIYDSLAVNTRVMSSKQFYAFLESYLDEEFTRPFLEGVLHKINDFKKAGHPPDNPKHLTVFFKTFVLDYFNKAYYHSDCVSAKGDQSWMIVLTKEKPTNGRFTFILDINILIIKVCSLFGSPVGEKCLLEDEDLKAIHAIADWPGRQWLAGQLFLELKSNNGYFQFYICPRDLI
jgi:hypothetical protein